MLTTKRFAILLTTAMTLLVSGEAMAGGGFFPNLPSDFGFVLNQSKDVTATIVLDPNPNGPVPSTPPPLTPTGTFGAISISRKHYNPATAIFQVETGSSLGGLAFGCDLSRTPSRFVELAPGVPGLPVGGPGIFGNWLSSDVTAKLFAELGVALVAPNDPNTVLVIPGITGVISQQCAPFPPLYSTIPPSPHPGFLILEVTIGFWAAPGTPTPK
jgi:hypothetical protein